MDKKRIVKDYEALPEEVVSKLKVEYPHGFAQNLISFTNKDGKRVSALPFETDEIYYLIRMTTTEAEQIIEEDEDYDEEGNLRDDFEVEAVEGMDNGSEEEEEESSSRRRDDYDEEAGESYEDDGDDGDDEEED